MKKVFCILSVLAISLPALAEGEPTVYETSVATANYVQGAYNALDAAKQAKLTSTNVVEGTGAVVTGVSADNGTVTVTKTNEVTVPVNSMNSETRANIWIE